jgi:hypothetical protein
VCRWNQHEVALAIEMGADAVDIGKTIHPHPTLARASAWRRRLPTAAERMCRLRASEAEKKLKALQIW